MNRYNHQYSFDVRTHELWSIEIIIHLTIYTEQQPHIKRRQNDHYILSCSQWIVQLRIVLSAFLFICGFDNTSNSNNCDTTTWILEKRRNKKKQWFPWRRRDAQAHGRRCCWWIMGMPHAHQCGCDTLRLSDPSHVPKARRTSSTHTNTHGHTRRDVEIESKH